MGWEEMIGTGGGSGPGSVPGGAGTLLAAERVISLLLPDFVWRENTAVAAAGSCPLEGRGPYRCFGGVLKLCLPGRGRSMAPSVKETAVKREPLANPRTAGS